MISENVALECPSSMRKGLVSIDIDARQLMGKVWCSKWLDSMIGVISLEPRIASGSHTSVMLQNGLQ